MTTTARDVIKDDDVQAMIEERTQEIYQFRRAYRNHDATGLNSGKFTFPVADDDLRDEVTEVEEDSDYPRTQLNYSGIDAEYTKEGLEIAISDEAIDDSAIDIVMDAMGEMAVAAERLNDSKAFTGLDTNRNATVVGTDGTDLNYSAVVAAWTTLFDAEYDPSMFELYVGPDGWGDLSIDERFVQATDTGDDIVRRGPSRIGEIYGIPIVPTNTGALGADEALLVDRSKFGYESTRWTQQVTSYREDRKDRDVYKIRFRNDFVVMDADSNLFIQGGVV